MRKVEDGGYGKDLYDSFRVPDGGWPRIDKCVVETSKSLASMQQPHDDGVVWSGKRKSSGQPCEGCLKGLCRQVERISDLEASTFRCLGRRMAIDGLRQRARQVQPPHV